MHDVEIEVVDAPVLELFFADGLHAWAVVEGVPEFGDEEEVGAFDEAVFDGAGDALAGFDFVAVILRIFVNDFPSNGTGRIAIGANKTCGDW